MTRRLLPLLALVLFACPPIDTGENGSGPIKVGPEGGRFVREGAVLTIPAGALSTEAFITVTVIDSGIPEVPDRKRVSLGYRLSPSGLTFKEPATLILPYLDDRVPAGVDPGTFDMRRQAGEDAYLPLPGFKLLELPEFGVRAGEARTERLGLFWITSPAQAAVSKLTLEPEEAFLRVGDTQQFTARVTDPAGNELSLPITWRVVPARVAQIDENGLLTAKGPGPATVSASAANQTATASVVVQGTTAGPSTFVHENPFPTGNDLWGGAMVGGVAVFVGGNATVLSRDPADQWTRHFSNPAVVLRAVAGTSVDDAVAVGVGGSTGVLVELEGGSTAPTLTTFTTLEPRALWYDGTHGMAVGYGNDVLVRRSGAWVKEYSPSIETLLSVVGDGAGGFVTLGSRGSIYRFDPATKTWDSLFQTQLSVLLTAGALADSAGAEAWAAGGGKLWRFESGAWTAINLPATPELTELTELTALGVLDGKVVLGGRAGKEGHLLVYDAGSWTSVALRGPQVIRGIFGAGTQGYAVGDLGAVWEYSAGAFTEKSRGFYGSVADVSVAGATVVAAVNDCVDATCTEKHGSVVSRTGPFSWTEIGPAQIFAGPVFSVAARSSTDILAGGMGQVFRYDGTSWTPVPVAGGAFAPFNDIQYCGSEIWAVAAGGTIYSGTAAGLAVAASVGAVDLYSIHCLDASSIWIAGDRALIERVGSQLAARSTAGVNHASWRSVWSPGAGEAFAFGDARYGVYWDTTALKVHDAPGGILPDIINGLWGSSMDNLYAVGYTVLPSPTGYAVRFDGAQWRLVDAGAQRRVTAIHGSSSTEIWLATEGGGLLRAVAP